MPDCEYFEELCSMALDGELSRAQKRELDAHLAECPACAAYMEDLKLMRTAWGDVKEPLPEALHQKIMSGVVEEAQKNAAPAKEKRKRRPPVFTMIAAAAACVLLAVSGAAGDLFGGLKVEQDEPVMAAAGSADSAGAAMEDLAPAAQDPEDTGKPGLPAQDPDPGASDAGYGKAWIAPECAGGCRSR